MIFRNTLLSLASLGIPLVVGLVTVPHIVGNLGLPRFGVLTLVWAIIGYASLLDLGMSRALTKRVAALHGRVESLRSVIRTGLRLTTVFGIGMGVISLIITYQFDYARFDILENEFSSGVLLLAASVPVIIISSALRGILEGLHEFTVVSLVRLGFGLVTFIAPVCSFDSGPRIDYIIALMLIGRMLGALIMAWTCRYYFIKGNLSRSRRAVEQRNLLSFGGWITVSNLASALMLYVDRFFIASSPFASSLAFYTMPYEFITKIFILPSAVSGVIFPYMANGKTGKITANQLLFLSSAIVLATVAPIVAVLVLYAPELLAWWISSDFGSKAAPPLRIIALGVLVNSLAQISHTYLLACGRPAWIAKLHAIELIFFLPLIYVSIQYFGIIGAAWVWTLRILIDSTAMAFMLGRIKPLASHRWKTLLSSLAVSGLIFGFSNLGNYSKTSFLAILIISCAAIGILSIRSLRARI